MASQVERGRWAETIAAYYLRLQGYTVLDRNVRVGHLEIDLVARKGRLLCVVEVKYRATPGHGGAAGAVGVRKQRDLETAALTHMRRAGLRGSLRFDVITVTAEGEQGLKVTHLPGAFRATGRYRA